jgi:hypothetical protein
VKSLPSVHDWLYVSARIPRKIVQEM